MAEPSLDELKLALETAKASSISQAIKSLRDMRDQKYTWFGREENDLRIEIDKFLRDHNEQSLANLGTVPSGRLLKRKGQDVVKPKVIHSSNEAQAMSKANEFLNFIGKNYDEPMDDQDSGDDNHSPDMQKYLDDFYYEMEATETEADEGNPPSWVEDESSWEEAKQASKDSYGEIRYPFVSWFYINVLKGGIHHE